MTKAKSGVSTLVTRLLGVCFLAYLAYSYVAGFAPLDGLAALVGTPPLNDPASFTQRHRPIEDVEHVACHASGGSCLPAGGCSKKGSKCVPEIGHYWTNPEDASPAPHFLSWILPPLPPPMYMMTAKGVLMAESTISVTHYRLLDEPEEMAKPFSTLPGVGNGAWILAYVAIPGLITFLGTISCWR